MNNPLTDILGAMAPLMPARQPVKNPVSEFIADLLEAKLGDIPEAELLNIIGINNANSDPNGVLDLLVDLHDRIGVFVTRMQDGEFKEWTAPEATAEPADTDLRQIDTDIRSGEKSAVLELP